ncbi:serine hydrolase domain-containing protein [Plantactinospora endophytica]|uniref:Serine hydrolase n=1 Tax=Plantactinospora endophytica TaxID=673535 RepID=A0ABQ4E5C1_9ACTN|nr:serine hydrolase domain-containing protein [Plantactinospora endophytica]GIG89522.1 serine hydrolase [Plantactinospora endophytica]
MTDSTDPDRLHAAMAARVDRGDLPGLVTVLARGGEARIDPIGTLTVGGTAPMRADTIFRITSMTKPVLGVATMMLVEEGRLALDEPVDRLLPELAGRGVLRRLDGPLDDTVPAARPTTVEDLLTFRMGHGLLFEPNFQPGYPVVTAADELGLAIGPPDPRSPHDPEEWLRQFGTLPLMHSPGERWQYDTAAEVLGVLVARAAGRPLPEFLADRIFTPLGMADTGFVVPAGQADRLAGLYVGDPETGALTEREVSRPAEWATPPAFPSGANGLVSTAPDYLAFARLLLHRGVHQGRRLLSEKSVELMTTNQLTPEQIAAAGPVLDGYGWGYCLSVAVTPDESSPIPGGYGWTGGYGTSWFTDPHRDLIAIVLTQTVGFLFDGGLAEFRTLA